MSDCDYRGISLDSFMRCPIPGCEAEVLSISGQRNYCSEHGGHMPEYRYTIDGTHPELVAERPPRSAAEPA